MRSAKIVEALLAQLLLLTAAAAHAQDVPLPSWVRSAEVVSDLAVAYVMPDEHAARRGTLAIGTRLPVLARVKGAGCGDFKFVQVGEQSFICERELVWSKEPPAGRAQPVLADNALLPLEYMFVTVDGTGGFARPSDYAGDDYSVVLGQDFGVVAAQRTVYEGVHFVRTQHGYYVRQSALRPAKASEFAGATLSDGKLEGLGWIVGDHAQKRATPKAKPSGLLPRLTLVHVTASDSPVLLRLEDGTLVLARDVARPRPATPPQGAAPDERWIDVDTQTQILTVYQGSAPIFATLVSTGLASPVTETPKGEFRIWVKVTTSDMNDTEREDLDRNYSIESVPWVQYFHDSVALHAVFWHERFGERHSHGCVNLSPRDARTVFNLTKPVLPDGYYAILPTGKDVATRIVVR
ncbi:MAG TPA: L,D-transpeptidase [Polyangiales bacterium]